jgi:hypothetical protein
MPTPPSSEKQSHVEAPSTTEISRRQVGSPGSGQLIRVVSSPKWELDIAVFDEEEWVRIPYQIREILLQLKREFGKLGASRIVVNVSRK